ncbi:hypothetical protein [Persephonella sp.]
MKLGDILKKSLEYRTGSLWLMNVEEGENLFGIPLGSERSHPRIHRPLIILDSSTPLYEIIFLSRKGKFSINLKECSKKLCKDKVNNFRWRDKSKVYYYKNLVFYLTKEQLDEIAEFCGICPKEEIDNLKKKITNYLKEKNKSN